MEKPGVFKMRFAAASAAVLLVVSAAHAQTRIAGSMTCPKPGQVQSLPVGDKPDHVMTIFKGKCSWSKAVAIETAQAQSTETTGVFEIDGDRFREFGYDIITMSNGEKLNIGWRGSGTAKGGMPVSANGAWRIVGGKGSMTDMKGNGTYSSTATPDGGMSTEIEGQYEPRSK
jgi:hypothetical protein